MTTMGIIIAKMALCLIAALLVGLLFGYLFARARTKERYEDKIDALEELCENKKEEARRYKELYGKKELEANTLHEEIEKHEELLVTCKKREEELMTQLDLLVEENGALQEKLSQAEAQDEDGSEIVAKIEQMMQTLEEEGPRLASELKKELKEDLQEAREMVQNGTKNGKIAKLLDTIAGKFRRK